jgi:hypothetical protein
MSIDYPTKEMQGDNNDLAELNFQYVNSNLNSQNVSSIRLPTAALESPVSLERMILDPVKGEPPAIVDETSNEQEETMIISVPMSPNKMPMARARVKPELKP